MKTTSEKNIAYTGNIAICGNPNSGKTTIFNVITGLKQKVGNYPGVTIEKVSGHFFVSKNNPRKYKLLDIPGSYSLSAYSPDEYIAASSLFGEQTNSSPDAIIVVIDATNLERGLYLLFQVLQIGKPVVVALNMVDLAERGGIRINNKRLSNLLGGIPVVPVVGNKGKGIDKLKQEITRVISQPPSSFVISFGEITENLLEKLKNQFGNHYNSRAQYLRVIFDEKGPAERNFISREGEEAFALIIEGRKQLENEFGSLLYAETHILTDLAEKFSKEVTKVNNSHKRNISETIDKYLLHPILGPIILVITMFIMFQSIFSWAIPFMDIIDKAFSLLGEIVKNNLAEGPLQSLLVDGVIGGVGSVLMFVPQIAILFIFIAILEDSGYLTRAAFLVDRMFRWCGLSGKSFIPLLSSFACAVPGIMATRTIENKKLRFITIMVAPFMTYSARLPVYSIMIAAFIPYKSFLGIMNLQGLVLALLYLLGIVMAVIVSFVLKKLINKKERDTFIMEMPSYKVPSLNSITIRVINRVNAFVKRAGTVILAITIIIWALSYYPQSGEALKTLANKKAELVNKYQQENNKILNDINALFNNQKGGISVNISEMEKKFKLAQNDEELKRTFKQLSETYPEQTNLLNLYYKLNKQRLIHQKVLAELSNERAGQQIRSSYLGIMGRKVEPLFKPLGWDWKITMSVLASFPAREVIIATLGTIYNLGAGVDEQSTSLMDKMKKAKWEDGPQKGKLVFTPAVALSIMVFFALCCQCAATLVTIRQETLRWFYPIITFTYMTILAYIGGLVTYQIFSRMGI